MILVEGSDGAGKSTLVKHIIDEYSFTEGVRTTVNRDEIYKTTRYDTWNVLHDELLCLATPQVWDRIGPISDPIYAAHSIPARTPAFADEELTTFRHICRELTIPLIFCIPSWETVKRNVEGSHQMPGVKERIRNIYHNYIDLAMYGYPGCNTCIHNYEDDDSINGVRVCIDKFLRRRQNRAFSS